MNCLRQDDVVDKTPPLLIALPKQSMDVFPPPAPLEGASKTLQQHHADGGYFSYDDSNTTMMAMVTGSDSSNSHHHGHLQHPHQEISPLPVPAPAPPQTIASNSEHPMSDYIENSEYTAADGVAAGAASMYSSISSSTSYRKTRADPPSTLIGIGPESPTIISSPTGLLTISTGLSPARDARRQGSCASGSPGPSSYPLSMYGQPPLMVAPMHTGGTAATATATVPSNGASIFAPPSSGSIFGHQEEQQPSKSPAPHSSRVAAAAVPSSSTPGLARETGTTSTRQEEQCYLMQGQPGGAYGGLTGSDAARDLHDASVYGSNAQTSLPPAPSSSPSSMSLLSTNDAAGLVAQSDLATILLCQSPVAASGRANAAIPPAQFLQRQQQPTTADCSLLRKNTAEIDTCGGRLINGGGGSVVGSGKNSAKIDTCGGRLINGGGGSGLRRNTAEIDTCGGRLINGGGGSVVGLRKNVAEIDTCGGRLIYGGGGGAVGDGGPGPAVVGSNSSPWRGGYGGGCYGTSEDSSGGSQSGGSGNSSSSGEEEEEDGGGGGRCKKIAGGGKGLSQMATITGAGEFSQNYAGCSCPG